MVVLDDIQNVRFRAKVIRKDGPWVQKLHFATNSFNVAVSALFPAERKVHDAFSSLHHSEHLNFRKSEPAVTSIR